jgi:hypothetical protein
MKLKDTSRTVPRLRDVSKTVPKIDPSEIKQALGAEDTGVAIGAFSPVTLRQIRAELARRLTSSGGRPALSGTSQRVKIPLSETQWAELERIADDVSGTGCKTSPGQVASVIISLSLRAIDADRRNLKSETTT